MTDDTGRSFNADWHDWMRNKVRLMKTLGINCYSRDILEFGYNQYWDITCGGKYSGWFNGTTDYYSDEVDICSDAGIFLMPYYEYAGSRGPSGDGNSYLGTFDCCRQLKRIVLGSTLQKINGGKTFGRLMASEGSAGVEIYWKSAPPEFNLPNGLFHEAGGNIYTNYLPLTYKAEWTAFAQNPGISNFTLVLPETDDGVGTWTSGSTQVVKWWNDAPPAKSGFILIVR